MIQANPAFVSPAIKIRFALFDPNICCKGLSKTPSLAFPPSLNCSAIVCDVTFIGLLFDKFCTFTTRCGWPIRRASFFGASRSCSWSVFAAWRALR